MLQHLCYCSMQKCHTIVQKPTRIDFKYGVKEFICLLFSMMIYSIFIALKNRTGILHLVHTLNTVAVRNSSRYVMKLLRIHPLQWTFEHIAMTLCSYHVLFHIMCKNASLYCFTCISCLFNSTRRHILSHVLWRNFHLKLLHNTLTHCSSRVLLIYFITHCSAYV